MIKANIVARIAQNTEIEKSVTAAVVGAFMESIRESMIARNEVFLRGFGSFILKQKAGKKTRNSSKNTTIVISTHHAPTFKPAKILLDAVKKGR